MATESFDDAIEITWMPSDLELSESDWGCLETKLAIHYEGGLFTILQVDRANGLVRRARSSNPGAYAAGGTKQLMGTPWARHVIDEGRCFIAATPAEMEFAFSDHSLLSSLGCTTALNLPLRHGSSVAWTVNLLRGGAAYTPAESLVVKAAIKEWIGGVIHG